MRDRSRRPVQPLAGVSGGALEDDRDPALTADLESDRSVAHDKRSSKKVEKLNDTPTAPEFEATTRKKGGIGS